jgi:hypothetical protein
MGADSGRYPAAMYGEFNPLRQLSLTLVTDHLIVVGMAMTHPNRLVDMINEVADECIVLQDATFSELGSRRVVAQAGVGQVRMSDVLFVHMTEPMEVSGNEWMRKQPVPATLLLPPFTVQGTIYLSYEAELRLAVEAYTERFVPVTGAQYWSYSVAESPASVDLLIVNHRRAHVAVAPEVGWRSEPPADVAQKPW